VAALINMDVGRILHRPPDTNADFVVTVRAAAAKAGPIAEAPASTAHSTN
jgi:hypothetical protein